MKRPAYLLPGEVFSRSDPPIDSSPVAMSKVSPIPEEQKTGIEGSALERMPSDQLGREYNVTINANQSLDLFQYLIILNAESIRKTLDKLATLAKQLGQ